MPEALFAELLAATTGLLLLSATLQVWRRSLTASIRLLAVQGVALAGLVATIGLHDHELELLPVALLVLVLKAATMPWVLSRVSRATGATREETPRMNPTSALMVVALLTTLAYVVSQPVVAVNPGPASRAVPIGVALALIGFLVLLTRRRALSQLIGFVVLDNGIAAVAFLTAGGVPLVVELGASLDVLLIVLILRVLTSRMQLAFGDTDLDDLTELRD